MKDNFDEIIEKTLKAEGGYVDHPRDPGGATNMGITRKTLARWRKVTPYTKLPKSEVKNLSKSEAKDIYRALYWDAVNGDVLPSGLDYAVFDFGVHSGPQVGVKKLQELVGTATDGVVGNQTLAAVADYPRGLKALILSYNDSRMKFLMGLANFAVFGKGWKNRVDQLTKDCLVLAGKSGIADTKNAEDNEGKDNPAPNNFLPLLLKVLLALAGLIIPGLMKRFNKVE